MSQNQPGEKGGERKGTPGGPEQRLNCKGELDAFDEVKVMQNEVPVHLGLEIRGLEHW